jgi:hypothetical protein
MAARMEDHMATVVALDVSPIGFLRSLRGQIVGARIAHPEVLHIEVHDARGDLWRLATQDASWSPGDPAQLIGRSIDDALIDEENGNLRLWLSDDSTLDVKPTPIDAEDDPPNWELISPTGLVLEFGPGVRWQFSSADARPSPHR